MNRKKIDNSTESAREYRNKQIIEAAKQSKIRGKSAPRHLAKGTILSSKYKTESFIGGGGFGQIYRAVDMRSGVVVAVKVELREAEAQRIILEQMVLAKLMGSKHIPRIYHSGSQNGTNFIVMQMLGNNLSDLRKSTINKRLSTLTTVRVGIQMIQALRTVHTLGFLHRDVKPPNMCIGIGEHRRIIFLVDYGLVRQFRTDSGEWRRERRYAAFRGTARYVSVSVHERQEQGPIDDLWSLYYSLIELGEGELPWKNCIDQEETMKLKKNFLNPTEIKLNYLPKQFICFLYFLLQCPSKEMPNYDEAINIMRKCCKRVDEEAEFEWDYENSTQSD